MRSDSCAYKPIPNLKYFVNFKVGLYASIYGYMRQSFVEGLLRKSVPQSTVAARLRLNELCMCTSEACKYSIRSAIAMAAAMASCSTAILAAKQ